MAIVYFGNYGDYNVPGLYAIKIGRESEISFTEKMEKASGLFQEFSSNNEEVEVKLYFFGEAIDNLLYDNCLEDLIYEETDSYTLICFDHNEDGIDVELDLENYRLFNARFIDEAEECYGYDFEIGETDWGIEDLSQKGIEVLKQRSKPFEDGIRDVLTKAGFRVIDVIPTWIPENCR